MVESNFSVADELSNVKSVLDGNLKKINASFSVTADPSLPIKVRASL